MEPTPHLHLAMTRSPVSRRTTLRGIGTAGIATALGLVTPHRTLAGQASAEAMIEPEAGSWKTWILESGDQLRPEAPPDETASQDELGKLRDMVADRDAVALDRISYWDAGSPGYRWNEIATQQTQRAQMGPNAYRVLALMNGAIYDATIAAWDAKYTYNRPRPAATDAELATVIATPNSPSYPDAHAVTAGAAATVLAYLFPDEAERFSEMATEAAESRVMAGVAYPSDISAGLDLGREVGKLFVEYAKTDNSDVQFDPSTMPTGPGMWSGDAETLAVPTLGTWDTWVLEKPDQFRPESPPDPDSPERAAEIAEIKNYERDVAPFTELWFWPQDPAGRQAPDSAPFSSNQVIFYYAPVLHFLWGPELAQKLFEYRWDSNPPRAARAYALVSIASHDSTVACWDAKFHYWTARPVMFDPEIETVLPTYPIPDYPSGHATGLAATAQVLSYLFPRDEQFFQSRAEENAASRVWAGIHFRSASDAGLQLGREVGDAVIEWAESDGSD
ncbi:MAG: Phosphoesterase, PA-phosphatase related [Thermomicrobiales bacterium]|nr:Phosphoesterase, PA-phosphatase related [Thermomicrobiales bacterium]